MPEPLEIVTNRLRLRPWRDADLAPFAAMNADAEVMAHYPAPLARAASDAMVERIGAHFARHGFGLWAVEAPGVAEFLGYVSLLVPSVPFRFASAQQPPVEVGWRLGRAHWGQGYATEAARAALDVGFGRFGLAEVVSFTVPANHRSRAVMERLGMRRAPADDFDHPALPEGHALRRHVLYRLPRRAWRERHDAAR
jgi:RimJ/RimL family protein N-acetyltransferase